MISDFLKTNLNVKNLKQFKNIFDLCLLGIVQKGIFKHIPEAKSTHILYRKCTHITFVSFMIVSCATLDAVSRFLCNTCMFVYYFYTRAHWTLMPSAIKKNKGRSNHEIPIVHYHNNSKVQIVLTFDEYEYKGENQQKVIRKKIELLLPFQLPEQS